MFELLLISQGLAYYLTSGNGVSRSSISFSNDPIVRLDEITPQISYLVCRDNEYYVAEPWGQLRDRIEEHMEALRKREALNL